jgi:CheY-like chemotaxis protein
MRVLVVDDSPDNLELLSMAMTMWGHEAVVLQDSTLALSTAVEFLPQVVFLDLGMPDVDGWEIARQLRQHTALAGTFLVALTGYGREEDQAKSQAAGFDLHLLKPVDLEEIETILKKLSQSGSGEPVSST